MYKLGRKEKEKKGKNCLTTISRFHFTTQLLLFSDEGFSTTHIVKPIKTLESSKATLDGFADKRKQTETEKKTFSRALCFRRKRSETARKGVKERSEINKNSIRQ